MPMKPGTPVAYRKKDHLGYVWITALVRLDDPGRSTVALTTDPGGVSISVPRGCLTQVRTIWIDTHGDVKDENDGLPERRA